MDHSSSPHLDQKSTCIAQPSLFVGNFPAHLKEDVLRDLFKDFDITRVMIYKPKSCDDNGWRARKVQIAQVDFSRIEDGMFL
jgi:RNA recognition motif-containing protein